MYNNWTSRLDSVEIKSSRSCGGLKLTSRGSRWCNQSGDTSETDDDITEMAAGRWSMVQYWREQNWSGSAEPGNHHRKQTGTKGSDRELLLTGLAYIHCIHYLLIYILCFFSLSLFFTVFPSVLSLCKQLSKTAKSIWNCCTCKHSLHSFTVKALSCVSELLLLLLMLHFNRFVYSVQNVKLARFLLLLLVLVAVKTLLKQREWEEKRRVLFSVFQG